MYPLIYSRAVNNDLEAIFNYIAEGSRESAVRYLSGIEDRIKRLSDFPTMGSYSRYPELQTQKIRILTHDKYLIFYRFDGESVYIIRILHGAMNYVKLF